MLRKINLKITKLLFYLKNNLLGIAFKTTLFGTMLVLVYLVSVLRQADSAKPAGYTVVQPIEESQKLMLTVPSESTFGGDPFSTTTEILTTLDNFIPKTIDDENLNEQPFLPVQEQTTTTSTARSYTTTQPGFVKVTTTTENNVIPSPESTILSIYKLWESTTLSMDQTSTVDSMHIIDQVQTTPDYFTTIVPELSTTTDWAQADFESTTLDPIPITTSPKTDDLFRDNWSSYLPEDNAVDIHTGDHTDIPINNPDIILPILETTTDLGVLNVAKKETNGFFVNEGEDYNAMEVRSHQHSLQDRLKTQSKENFTPDDYTVKGTSPEDKPLALENPSLLNPNNLLNLFAIDHLPATSNMKFTWWPTPKSGPVASASSKTYTVVKSDGSVSNAIVQNVKTPEKRTPPTLFNKRNQFQELDSFLNEKLKNSVTLLERLFGNFL